MENKGKRVLFIGNVYGFTLMEVVVVIAILGALTALALPRFTGVLENSQQKTDQANIRIVESAMELYQAEKGAMPSGVTSFDGLIEELNKVGYIKNKEIKAVSDGKKFTYDATSKSVSITDD